MSESVRTGRGAIAGLEGLTVRYGSAVVLDQVTLAVEPGSVYALLGRNGAGKSSAVRCLLGLQRPQAGRGVLFGGDAWPTRALAMARVGVVPEEPDAPPEMTAPALERLCRSFYQRWDSAGVAERLRRFAVPSDVPFARLSKGQKGQVMLALALGHAPELLILDDPTLGLDAVARRELYAELVGELADRGTTVFITSHDLAGIEGIATRVGIVSRGRLAVDEELEQLKARFRSLRFRRRPAAAVPGPALQALQVVGSREREWGVETVVAGYDEASFERLRASAEIVAPEASAMSLEEIFVAVAGDETGGR